jgi:23S rRNA (guanine745-N1)-methyltransferase
MLICPVRDCGRILSNADRTLRCENRHSFDRARSGYINLLQPQDRRSKRPGDSTDAVAARRRLHDRGLTQPLLDAILRALGARSEDTILDAGCGEGYYLGEIAKQTRGRACGIDISVPAIDAAAKRYPGCEWIVANADRMIPYAGGSFSQVMSVTARMNTTEFHRVLKKDGRLLVAIPAADDLIELRGAGRDRTGRTIEAFSPHFRLLHHSSARTVADLDAAAVEDILLSIYRPIQPQPAVATQVTFSLELLVFQAKE